MPECVFCQIAEHKAPAKIEYEDKEIIAFPDINPQAPVHILIIPKKHIESLRELEDLSIFTKLVSRAVNLAKKKNIYEDGFRLVVNTGKAAGQIVEHLHLHLIGKKKGK